MIRTLRTAVTNSTTYSCSGDLVFPGIHCPGGDCSRQHQIGLYRDISLPHEQRGWQPPSPHRPPGQAARPGTSDCSLHLLAGTDSF